MVGALPTVWLAEPSTMGPDPAVAWIPLGVGTVLALLALWGSLRALGRRRLIQNLPTSKVKGVFIGLVELKGTAEAERPITTYLAEVPCVYYTWSVQEHWSRTVTETYTDSKGNTQTRTRHESGWATVDHGGEMIDFYLKDDTGVILVRPEGATVEAARVFEETCTPSDALYYSKGPPHAVANSDYRRLFQEQAIRLHEPLYLIGPAREREDVVAPEIAHNAEAAMYLISHRDEEQVARGFLWGSWGWGTFGLVLGVAGTVLSVAVARRALEQNIPFFALAAGVYVLAWWLGWVWMVYNGLVNLHQRVRQAWSLVDVQLKRRRDLIPRLVEVVKGMRDYERQVQEELAHLRSQAQATPEGAAGPDPQGCAAAARAIVERYPELKANESFGNLQKQLSDTEQRIALARAYYNEIATQYNTRLGVLPDRCVAWLARLKPRELMQAADFERAPVRVSLAQ